MLLSVLISLILLQTQLSLAINLSEILPFKHDIVRVRSEDELRSYEDSNRYAVLDFIGLVERHGYTAEEHQVRTRDGYNLVLHRITGSPNYSYWPGKPVVLLQHGAAMSSDSFVLIGPDKDLAFLLVDAGYDVWLGNVRGNTYSRSHAVLTPDDKDFWQFSYHEIGQFDLSASIDYILFSTQQSTLTFIGYSMAAPEILVLLSTIPEYNAKVNLAVLLAPVVIWQHKLPQLMRIYGANRKLIHNLVTKYNYYEWLPQSSFMGKFARKYCSKKFKNPRLLTCSYVVGLLADLKAFNVSAYPTIFAHFPAGTSYKCMNHYWQNIDTGEFHAYDYGTDVNLALYSSPNPPQYDLSQVTAPIAIYYGDNDYFATYTDQKILRQRLPNVVLFKKVLYNKFNHLDFLWSKYAREFLYDDVISFINRFTI